MENTYSQNQIDQKMQKMKDNIEACPLDIKESITQVCDLIKYCLKVDQKERCDFLQIYQKNFITKVVNPKKLKRDLIIYEANECSKIEKFKTNAEKPFARNIKSIIEEKYNAKLVSFLEMT